MNPSQLGHPEDQEIYEYIKEYLKYNNLSNTLECFEAENKTKLVSSKVTNKKQNILVKKEELPRIYTLFKAEGNKTKREINMEKEMKTFNKKYQQILQAGRQIFSVSINLLQMLHSMKEVKIKL